MNINRISRLPAMLGASLLLCGCVVGQRLVLDAPAAADLAEPHQGHAQVAVDDLREAVVNGEQDPWVIGQYRAALGVPWPVTTEGRIPLAQQIREDLEEALAALGFTPGPGARQLEILIRAWDFTGYQNGRFWYALDIGTRAPDGNPLAGSRLEDEIEIKGTFMLGARGGFERDMPDIYAGIIEAVLRTDPGILESLRQ